LCEREKLRVAVRVAVPVADAADADDAAALVSSLVAIVAPSAPASLPKRPSSIPHPFVRTVYLRSHEPSEHNTNKRNATPRNKHQQTTKQ